MSSGLPRKNQTEAATTRPPDEQTADEATKETPKDSPGIPGKPAAAPPVPAADAAAARVQEVLGGAAGPSGHQSQTRKRPGRSRTPKRRDKKGEEGKLADQPKDRKRASADARPKEVPKADQNQKNRQ